MLSRSRNGWAAKTCARASDSAAARRAWTGRVVSPSALIASETTACCGRVELSAVVVRGQDPLEQQHALGEHQLDVHAGADLDAGVVQPGADRVAPRLHLEGPRTLGVGAHGGGHPGHLPGYAVHPPRRASYAVGVGEHHLGAELVVSLAEHQGGHVEELAHGCLRRMARQVDDGCHVHDRDTADHGARLSESARSRKRRALGGPASGAASRRRPGQAPAEPPGLVPSARFSLHPQLASGQLVTRHLTLGCPSSQDGQFRRFLDRSNDVG